MEKFIVRATLTKNYEVEVEAEDAMKAIESLDEWIADDFEDFEVGARWDFEA
jgi:phosphotransferase system HPr-like phosphotransfer protein